MHAGEWCKAVAAAAGGKGGGSAEAGQAASSQPDRLAAALEEARVWAEAKTK